jgi:general secretion pathway protein A
MTEVDSAVRAFNVLAKLWQARVVTKYKGSDPTRGLELLASRRGLRLAAFNGNFEELRRMDSPALLEFTIPGLVGRRYLALTGFEGDRVLVAPRLMGRASLSREELESSWSGRAYLLWKNSYNIPPLPAPGTNGEAISHLQRLLQGAGTYKGVLNGTFDRETIAAVKDFQMSRGITPDGKVGTQTLLLLYQAGDGSRHPRLGQKKGN